MPKNNKKPVKSKINPVGRPKRADKDNEQVPGAERGTLPGETRKGYIVNIELAGKIDAVAFWQNKKIKDVVNEAFTEYVKRYESTNGPVKIPNKIKLKITSKPTVPLPKNRFRISNWKGLKI